VVRKVITLPTLQHEYGHFTVTLPIRTESVAITIVAIYAPNQWVVYKI